MIRDARAAVSSAVSAVSIWLRSSLKDCSSGSTKFSVL